MITCLTYFLFHNQIVGDNSEFVPTGFQYFDEFFPFCRKKYRYLDPFGSCLQGYLQCPITLEDDSFNFNM